VKKFVVAVIAISTILLTRTIAFASDGDLDTSWGGTGIVVSNHVESSTSNAISNYPGDRVLTVGSVTDGAASRILVNRFLVDGSFDTSCNGSGEIVVTDFDAVASDLVVLPDESFIVVGTMQIDNVGTLFVAKFTSSCSLDQLFGTEGIATYEADFGTSGRALVLQSNGSIVVVGDEYTTADEGNGQRILVTRFTGLGTLDSSFGSNGRFLSSSNLEGLAEDVVIDDEDQIVFVGSIVGTTAPDAAIVGRLASNGQLDLTFANQGYFIDELSGDPQFKSIAQRANGNFVVVGSYVEPTTDATKSILVVCLTSAGEFDSECAPDGWGYFGANTVDTVTTGIAITDDGFMILGGVSFPISGAPASPFVMRFDHTANLDTSFSNHGVWTDSSLSGQIHSVSIQDDGRIIAAGQIEEQGIMSLGVVRLGNTVSATTTTSSTTSVVAPTTTLTPNQLPTTGHEENGLVMAGAIIGAGMLLLGARRRALR